MTDQTPLQHYVGGRIVRADEEAPPPRRFILRRHVDVSGVSGTGAVADGVLWPDGTASVRWRGEHPSIVFWDRGRVSVEHIHGHQGATEIEWIDEGTTVAIPAQAGPAELWQAIEDALDRVGRCPSRFGRVDAVYGAVVGWLARRSGGAA
ncbi:hypothetical protein AB0H29_08285 [Streptomyces thermolilacinus]